MQDRPHETIGAFQNLARRTIINIGTGMKTL